MHVSVVAGSCDRSVDGGEKEEGEEKSGLYSQLLGIHIVSSVTTDISRAS